MSALTSKTLYYHSRWSPLEIKEKTIKLPLKPHEIVVKANYTALNPVDIKLKTIAFIPGAHHPVLDFGGEVEVVGSAVTRFKVGDQVSGFFGIEGNGFTGTRVLVDTSQHSVFLKPSTLTAPEAGSFGLVFGTAVKLLEAAPKLGPDSTVLVNGGGTSVGSFVIQLLKKVHGVKRVVSISSGSSAEAVRGFGADDILDYRTVNIPDAVKADAAKNGKYNAVIDTAGGHTVLDIWRDVLLPKSQGGVYATCAGDVSANGDYNSFVLSMVAAVPATAFRFVYNKVYGLDYKLVLVKYGPWVEKATETVTKYDIKASIDSIYPFAEFQDAWNKVDSSSARGKVVLDMRNA